MRKHSAELLKRSAPEYRLDLVTGRWVVVAKNRANRPLEYTLPVNTLDKRTCPFCEGNESATPKALLTIPPESSDWRVRVVPNLYPALIEVADHPRLDFDFSPGQTHFESKAANGIHAVVIESPHHVPSLTDLEDEDAAHVLLSYRQLYDHARAKGYPFAMVFKNRGAAAGVSLEHIHSQFVALPIVPSQVREELAGAAAFHAKTGKCVFCRMIDEEIAKGERIVAMTDRFIAICPYASRFPYETWIIPRSHSPRFDLDPNNAAPMLGTFLRRILKRIEKALQPANYNYFLHSAPFDTFPQDHYHWHIEIIPRLATLAGLELGAGIHVNIVAPEDAAGKLRHEGL